MHLYFYGFSDETIHLAGFCGKEFGFLQSDNVVFNEAVFSSATSPLQTQPDINTTHNPATDILHSPAYEDGKDSEFRNVGN